ncbi:MAG: hypothetical protein ACR2OR_06425 [Hyphomicrobiales bacterium]
MTATPILVSDLVEMHASGGDNQPRLTITIFSSSGANRDVSARFDVGADDFSVLADDLARAALMLRAKNLELEARAKIDPN